MSNTITIQPVSPATKKYEENQKLMRNYVDSHIELNHFINALAEIQKAKQDNRHTSLIINVGESKKDGFLSYLENNVANPRVLFSSFEKDSDIIPQIIISDKTSTIATLSLDCIKIISSKIENDDKDCSFDRYSFALRFNDKFDYDMTLVVGR